MENVAGEQGLALQYSNIFLRCPLNLQKIQIDEKTARGLKLDHFDIFDVLFPFLAFFKLKPIIYNIFRKLLVTWPQLQRAYSLKPRK